MRGEMQHPGTDFGRAFLAGVLSMLLPGAGQVARGAWGRGLAFLAGFAAAVGALGLAATRPVGAVSWLLDNHLLLWALGANGLLLGLRVLAVLDASRARRAGLAHLAVGALVLLTAAPHVAAGYVTVRGDVALERVFADEEPGDVLPADGLFLHREPAPRPPVEPDHDAPLPTGRPLSAARDVVERAEPLRRPWVTILLLGSDEGPGQPGDRTDTIILAALERGTGRAVAFGIPRNLVHVPLAGEARSTLRYYDAELNSLYRFAAEERPELFPGGRDPGATAMKQTVSHLLGVRVDYYAMVDLDGFRDLVDALGGVTITPRERIVDSVTRPAWGEPKPRIDVVPGRTYHFDGRTALAYVRSRKASDDYARMHRQRCFLSAMARQLDVVRVLRRFGAVASIVEESLETDMPRNRLPDLLRLVSGIRERRTFTVTFGREYILRRRARDGFPVPDAEAMRAVARATLLEARGDPERDVESVRRTC